MRARLVEVNAGGSRPSRLLTVLGTGALVAMASAACGGAAPATMTGEPTATAVPTYVPTPAPTMAPTPVVATGPADGETPVPITWEVRDAPYRVSDVVSTGALLIAVGTAGSSAESGDVAGVWTSPDGQTWEAAKVTQPAGTIAAVAAGSGRLTAVGTVEDDERPCRLDVNGRPDVAGHPGFGIRRFPRPRAAGQLQDVAAGPGGFVAVGSEVGAGGFRATAWYSPDGLVWTRTQSDMAGDSAGAVVQFGSGYVAAGWSPGENGDDRALFWTSPDGRTWEAAPDAKDLHDVGSSPVLAAAGQHLVAFGGRSHAWVATEPLVWTSQDGVTWESQASGRSRSATAERLPGGVGRARDRRPADRRADRHRSWIRRRRRDIHPWSRRRQRPGYVHDPSGGLDVTDRCHLGHRC